MKERIKSFYATPIFYDKQPTLRMRTPEEFTPVDSYEDYKRNRIKDEIQYWLIHWVALILFAASSFLFFHMLYPIK